MKDQINKATHTIRTDIVNDDASVKRIEVDFCKTDHWTESYPGTLNIAEMLQAGINEMVSNDANIVGSQETIINKQTCKELEGILIHPTIVRPELLKKAKQSI